MSADGAMLGAVRRMAVRRLAAGRIANETAGLDARLLVAGALGIDAGDLVLADYRAVTAAELARIEAYLDRRLAGEPVARILARKEFWGLPMGLSAETLVPRPDTETLVEAVLACFDRRGGRERALRIVDLGSGSGAILLALLSELPNAAGVGVDLSEGAAATARANAVALGLADRSLFVRGCWGESCAAADVIVANPPYIRTDVIGTLDREVRDYDPRLALDGGADGLDAYRSILADIGRLMRPDGAVFFEIGFDQADAVLAMLAGAGLVGSLHRDLAGHARVIEAERAGGA